MHVSTPTDTKDNTTTPRHNRRQACATKQDKHKMINNLSTRKSLTTVFLAKNRGARTHGRRRQLGHATTRVCPYSQALPRQSPPSSPCLLKESEATFLWSSCMCCHLLVFVWIFNAAGNRSFHTVGTAVISTLLSTEGAERFRVVERSARVIVYLPLSWLLGAWPRTRGRWRRRCF